MKGEQLPLAVQLRSTASFDSYFAGANQPQVDLLREFARGDGGNAGGLFLSGPAGSGKTHLLQAAARLAHGRGRRVGYLSLATHDLDLLDGLETSQLLCFDDFDASALTGDTALRLLRLLDRLKLEGGRWLGAAQAAPERLLSLPPDLRTRLSAGVLIGLRPLDDAERRQLLRANALARGLELPDEVAQWLLNQLPRDPSSLLSVIEQLDRASLSAKRRLTLPFVQKTLSELK